MQRKFLKVENAKNALKAKQFDNLKLTMKAKK